MQVKPNNYAVIQLLTLVVFLVSHSGSDINTQNLPTLEFNPSNKSSSKLQLCQLIADFGHEKLDKFLLKTWQTAKLDIRTPPGLLPEQHLRVRTKTSTLRVVEVNCQLQQLCQQLTGVRPQSRSINTSQGCRNREMRPSTAERKLANSARGTSNVTGKSRVSLAGQSGTTQSSLLGFT